ncbi:hypothetical protein STEG23_000565 [Scotinomys teguina]
MWRWNQTSLEDFILQGLFDDSFSHLCLFLLIMLVFLTAVSGNSLTILLICADPRLHTPMYFLLSQLSLMDLMHVSTTIPKMASNYLSGKKSISFVGCATQHFLYLSVGGAECVLLALMSYDRYVAICHPLRYSVLMSRRVGMMMAVMSWLSASVNSLIHTSILMSFPFCGLRIINHFYCELPAVVKLILPHLSAPTQPPPSISSSKRARDSNGSQQNLVHSVETEPSPYPCIYGEQGIPAQKNNMKYSDSHTTVPYRTKAS